MSRVYSSSTSWSFIDEGGAGSIMAYGSRRVSPVFAASTAAGLCGSGR